MTIESFKCDRHSLICMSTIWPTMVGSGKNFQSKGSLKFGKHYFDIGFCKYSIS